MIGPNGAGKSTLFNVITGLYEPDGGDIRFHGESIVGLRPHQVARLGIARTFQNVHLFPNMTVLENAMVGQHCRTSSGIVRRRPPDCRGTQPRGGADPRARQARRSTSSGSGWPATGRISRRSRSRTRTGGGWRWRARSRRSPTLLLLDEPTAGMNPRETLELRDHIVRMRDELGLTVLVIEHDMRVVEGRVRPRDRVRLRAEDRGGHVRRGRARRTGHRGLPGHGTRRPDDRESATTAGRPILEMRNVSTHYGLVAVLRNVDVQIYAGEMVCLLGGNASGKTTTLKTILGYVTPSEGEVFLDGEVVSGLPTTEVVAPRHLDGSGEPAAVRRHDGVGEPGPGRLPASRPGGHRGGSRAASWRRSPASGSG